MKIPVSYSGFSLHGGVSCKSYERKKLKHICHYISRPSLSEERLSVNDNGQIIYKLKTAYQNGTTHIVLSPLDFLSRLSSLIPRPRVHLTRFHGVFAPHFKYRSLIISKSTSNKTPSIEKAENKTNQFFKRVEFTSVFSAIYDCFSYYRFIPYYSFHWIFYYYSKETI